MRKTTIFAATAAAALLGLVLLLAGAGCGDAQDTPGQPGPDGESSSLNYSGDTMSVQGAPAALPPADRAVQGASTGTTGGGTSAGGSDGALPLPQLADRKIIRTATLELSVENVGSSVDQVQQIAAAAGGFVSSSSLSTENPQGQGSGPPPRQTGSITIRVPAQAYEGVIIQLRGIAKEVRSEKSDSSEVTEEYTDLQARLRNLEATEGRYLELLAKAVSIQEILLVQDRLNSVRLEIERAQGRIKLLDDLTDLATISVQLHLPAPATVQEETQANWAQQAWDDAWAASQDVLRAMGTAGIVAGVVLAWTLVPGLVLLAAWRIFGGRRQCKPAA